jgi:hypothetical protein
MSNTNECSTLHKQAAKDHEEAAKHHQNAAECHDKINWLTQRTPPSQQWTVAIPHISIQQVHALVQAK